MSYPTSDKLDRFSRGLKAKLAINKIEVVDHAKSLQKTNNYCDTEKNTTGGALETIRSWFNNLNPIIQGTITSNGLVLPAFTANQLATLIPPKDFTLAIDSSNGMLVLFNPDLATWVPIAVIDNTPQTFADTYVLSDNPLAPGDVVFSEIPLDRRVVFLNRICLEANAAIDDFGIVIFNNPNNPGGRADPANAMFNPNGPGVIYSLGNITDFAGGPGKIIIQVGLYINSADIPPPPYFIYVSIYKNGVLTQGPTLTIRLEFYSSFQLPF